MNVNYELLILNYINNFTDCDTRVQRIAFPHKLNLKLVKEYYNLASERVADL